MEPVPQRLGALDYAPANSPDGVRVDRRNGDLSISMALPARRAMRLVTMIATLFAAGVASAWWWITATSGRDVLPVALAIFSTFTALGGAIALSKRFSSLWSPLTLLVTPQSVICTRRVGNRIGKDEWPRALLKGLRIARHGWNEILRREFRVELWLASATSVVLYQGPRDVAEFVAAEINAALGLRVLPELRTRHGRVTMQVFPGALEFQFARRWFRWFLILLVPAAGAAGVLEWLIFHRQHDKLILPEVPPHWIWARVTAGTVVLALSLLSLVHACLRRKLLLLANGRLVSLEFSLRTPLRQEWPANQVCDFVVTQSKPGRANLSLRRLDQALEIAVGDEPTAQLHWVREQLMREFAACPWFTGNATTSPTPPVSSDS